MRPKPRKCWECDTVFTPEYGHTKMCSDECKKIRRDRQQLSYVIDRSKLKDKLPDEPDVVTIPALRIQGMTTNQIEKRWDELIGATP